MTPSIDCRVQPLGPRDLDEILAIEQESFPDPWNRMMFEPELLQNPFGRLVGAVRVETMSATRLLGYICYWVVFDELRLMNVAVRPDHRRHGIARYLVRHALRDGFAQGTTRALLEVRAGNAAAQWLYDGLGFHQYGRRTSYYMNPHEDAILMQFTDWDMEDL